jgi:hypothetical protein
MITHQESAFSLGKYLISPLTKLTDAGDYAPSVSIRSGGGRATHDRIYRFVARFDTREAACRYACEQGLLRLHEATSPQPH